MASASDNPSAYPGSPAGGCILAIESSCDETSAAVVRDGWQVLSNVVASQLVHSRYGGVVPELASREHLRAIVPVVREAMQRSGLRYSDLAAVAVTEGPGLAGALLVGITFAKALAFGAGLPLISVNHLEGHIHAVLMESARLTDNPGSAPQHEDSPMLALVVSGGHTHLYLAERAPRHTWRYRNVGKTLDDAAGEAFDKVAKLLGLPYPGGPWVDVLSTHGDPSAVRFGRAQIKTKANGRIAPKLASEEALSDDAGGLDRSSGPDGARFDLSFSGIKTAVRRYVEVHALQSSIAARVAALRDAGLSTAQPRDGEALARTLTLLDRETLDLIASFQSSAIDALVRTTFAAARRFGARRAVVSGGVAANRLLRERMTLAARQHNLAIDFPSIALSTDNAAMIAAAAWPKLLEGDFAAATLEPAPQLRLGAA